ncbi:MAG: winged helix-turn-helix domain-containing protein [Bacteriovoracaceae bacterium]|jgi:tetratricopeptide (TPR) repeat protein|nr:winged helix-turn-helix domain-containing protein [Bacteriovoracaceae bacterium]
MINEKTNVSENQQKFMAASSTLEGTDAKFSFGELSSEQEHSLGQGFYRLAKLHYDKADLDKAKENFYKALEKTVYPQDAFATLKIYGFLIRIYSETLDNNKANEFIQRAGDLVEKFSNDLPTLGAEFFYNVGMIYTYKADFDQALDNFKLSHQKAGLENEPELKAKALYAMATACYHKELYVEAISWLDQLKELLTILTKGYLKGSMHVLYGHIYKDIGEYALAMTHYDEGMRLLQQKNCWNLYGNILLGKGVTLKKMGEYNQALSLFQLGKNTINKNYKRLISLYDDQVADVNDSSVDLYLDRHNRLIHEKSIGSIDFKHRFVLLEILFLLAKSPGKAFNKDDLSKFIWKEEYNPLIHDKLIYTSISRLRKLIEPKGTSRKYILRGKDGYTFNPRANVRFHKEEEVSGRKIIGNIEINTPV